MSLGSTKVVLSFCARFAYSFLLHPLPMYSTRTRRATYASTHGTRYGPSRKFAISGWYSRVLPVPGRCSHSAVQNCVSPALAASAAAVALPRPALALCTTTLTRDRRFRRRVPRPTELLLRRRPSRREPRPYNLHRSNKPRHSASP